MEPDFDQDDYDQQDFEDSEEEENGQECYIYIINKIKHKWNKVKNIIQEVCDLTDINNLPCIILKLAKINRFVSKDAQHLFGLEYIISSFIQEDHEFASTALITIQYMAELVLRMDRLFPEGKIRILQRNYSNILTYTSEEVACLIAMGFFCLYVKPKSELWMPPPINFTRLYEDSKYLFKQKLLFLLNYFDVFQLEEISILQNNSKYRNISFERISFSQSKYKELDLEGFWICNDLPLLPVTILHKEYIEDLEGTLMVDFAARALGGGVLHKGSTQEEIMFLLFPELIVAKAICAKMEPSEAIVIVGPKRYSKHSGYKAKVKYQGTAEDTQEIDQLGRIDRTVIAIDAMRYFDEQDQIKQFSKKDILRDINKAYIGFIGDRHEDKDKLKKISTGLWGCGVFHGNAKLKFLIQWIAASANHREMNFTAFKEKELEEVDSIYSLYQGSKISEVVTQLIELSENIHEE